MKTLTYLALVVAFLSISAQAEPKATAAAKEDPIVGNWIWRGDHFVTVYADGTVASTGDHSATWVYLKNPEAERKYTFTWDGGRVIDTITALADGKKLNAKDQNGIKYTVRRAPDQTTRVPK
jgi:hypothetical protein